MNKYQKAIELIQAHLNVVSARIESGSTAPEVYQDRDGYLLAIDCIKKVERGAENED